MNAMNIANAYKNQQVMTASPEQLTLLLYNGALRFINESIQALEQGDLEKSHNANLRAQDIVREFVLTLDMSYEFSQGWAQLYEYIENCLIQGNARKDIEQLRNGKSLLLEMRDTWQGVMNQVQVTRAAAAK